MNCKERTRGQPVAALMMLLAAWVGARAMILEAGSNAPDLRPVLIAKAPTSHPGKSGVRPGERDPRSTTRALAQQAAYATAVEPAANGALPSPARPDAPPFAPPFAPTPPRLAAGHLSLWLAAVSQMPLPALPGLTGAIVSRPLAAPFPSRETSDGEVSARRWSADGWLMWRQGGRYSLASGPSGAAYGASQMGAVLRYRLDRPSPIRPSVYLRATAALNGSREKEAGLGLSARPLIRLPVVIGAEMRITDDRAGSRLRPAIFAVTELPAFSLPQGLRGEAYVQAGYVGGRGATAFADGQLKVDREIAQLGNTELRAGGGVWGGAQRGANRLDLGPTASLGLAVTKDLSARLGIDWRMRVAGNAIPSSGPALTLSAGF